MSGSELRLDAIEPASESLWISATRNNSLTTNAVTQLRIVQANPYDHHEIFHWATCCTTWSTDACLHHQYIQSYQHSWHHAGLINDVSQSSGGNSQDLQPSFSRLVTSSTYSATRQSQECCFCHHWFAMLYTTLYLIGCQLPPSAVSTDVTSVKFIPSTFSNNSTGCQSLCFATRQSNFINHLTLTSLSPHSHLTHTHLSHTSLSPYTHLTLTSHTHLTHTSLSPHSHLTQIYCDHLHQMLSDNCHLWTMELVMSPVVSSHCLQQFN